MKFSLKKKAIVAMICITLMICLFTLVVVNKGINDVIKIMFWKQSTGIVNLISSELDAERVGRVQAAVREVYDQSERRVQSDQAGSAEYEAYLAQFAAVEETEDYQTLRTDLRRMRAALNVSSLNLLWLDQANRCYVNLVDADVTAPHRPGCIEPVSSVNDGALTNPTDNLTPSTITMQDGEKRAFTGKPVLDAQGSVIAYVTVEISYESVTEQRQIFLLIAALAQIIVAAIVCVIGVTIVSRFIIRPINKLSQAAELYASNRKSFSELHISKSDEIGILADSMSHMETEISGYIENLEKMTNDLISAREHAKQLNTVANIDPMTQVSNKRAYNTAAARLNEGTKPYGLVMIDMNNLKLVNDSCGHEKGDICIQNLCQIICRSFPHSPVYRVGGDEFIVILENDDYKERETLVQAITETFRQNAAKTELPLWENVVAAVGCAVFDPKQDRGIDDVLKRADEAMYEQKRAIKEAAKG